MEIRFDPGGMVTIIAGTHSHGQGHATAFAQLVAQWLGVPFEAINYIQGDTEKVAFGRGTLPHRSRPQRSRSFRITGTPFFARETLRRRASFTSAPPLLEMGGQRCGWERPLTRLSLAAPA